MRTFYCLAAFLLTLVFASLARPYYNFDMLMYVGMVNGQAAYADAQANVPPEEFRKLVREDGYRNVIASDPSAFQETLRFYTVKPLYPALIAAAEHLGLPGIKASLLIPRICIALLAALCCFLLSGYFRPVAAWAIALALVSTPYIFNLSRYGSPDALSVLFLTIMTALFLRPSHVSLRALAIVATLLARPDTVVYVGLMVLAWWLAFKKERNETLILGAVGSVTYLAVTHLGHAYSWGVLFDQAFAPNPYPASHPHVQSAREVLATYLERLNPANSAVDVLMVGVAAVSFYTTSVVFGKERISVVAAVVLFTIAAHWILAPYSDERLRSGYHLVSMLILVISLKNLAAPKSGAQMAPV